MAPEIDLDNQRPAQYVFSTQRRPEARCQRSAEDARPTAAQQKASTAGARNCGKRFDSKSTSPARRGSAQRARARLPQRRSRERTAQMVDRSPSGLDRAFATRLRQRAAGRIADDPQRRERQPVPRRRRRQATWLFHVDGGGTRREPQRGLVRRPWRRSAARRRRDRRASRRCRRRCKRGAGDHVLVQRRMRPASA